MHTSPSHSAGLFFPPWLKENTPRNPAGLYVWFLTWCAPVGYVTILWTVTWSATVMSVMWPITLSCYNPYSWAVLGRGKKALKKCTCFVIQVKETGCLSWALYSKRTYFYTSSSGFLYSYCFNMLSLMLSFRSRLISLRFMGFWVCQERWKQMRICTHISLDQAPTFFISS